MIALITRVVKSHCKNLGTHKKNISRDSVTGWSIPLHIPHILITLQGKLVRSELRLSGWLRSFALGLVN